MEKVSGKILWIPVIMGLSIIIGTLIIGAAMYKVKSLENTLSTTGSTKTQVRADMAKWNGSFTRTVSEANLKEGYKLIGKDAEIVKAFLKSKGIAEKDYNFTPIAMSEEYAYNKPYNEPKSYILTQNFEVQLNDVNAINDLAKMNGEIIDKGVLFSSYAPQFYYSKLPELRVQLLGEAMKDARDRANKIAESGGQMVDSLKSASVGVTQVLPLNSVDISDYGSYDTSSIDKEVMITVKAAFTLK